VPCRAARAVQAGDVDVVACIAADTNAPEGFRDALENFSRFSQDAVYPYGTGGPNVGFSLIAQAYMAQTGVAILRGWRYCNATMRSNPTGDDEAAAERRGLYDGASRRPADPSV
tara:strand:- start:428 stop:769 length:342 start_codon:yes stop_codon:yes gene_type:complete